MTKGAPPGGGGGDGFEEDREEPQALELLELRGRHVADAQPPEPDSWEDSLPAWAGGLHTTALTDRDHSASQRATAETGEARAREALERARQLAEAERGRARTRAFLGE